MSGGGAFTHHLERAVDGASSPRGVFFSAPEGDALLANEWSGGNSVDDLGASLLELAVSLGCTGARYVHLGHRPTGGTGGERPPVRFLSVMGPDLEPWRAGDPAVSAIAHAFLPFAWNTRDNIALPDVQRAWLSIERLKGVEAGVTIPVQDYLSGPACLCLFGLPEAAAISIVERQMRGLIATGIAVHLCARRLLPISAASSPALTDRELSCLRHAATGATLQASAADLGIARRTVEFHLSKAVGKLGALNKIHAVALAMSSGLMQI